MKKHLVTVLLLTGLMGFAQKEGPHGDRRMAMSDMTPEQIATLQTKKLALALDLTEAQQKEIRELQTENARLHRERMEAHKAAKDSMAARRPTAEERFDLQNDRLDRALAHKEKMKAILTPEQYEKWQKILVHKGHHRHFKAKGHRKEMGHGK